MDFDMDLSQVIQASGCQWFAMFREEYILPSYHYSGMVRMVSYTTANSTGFFLFVCFCFVLFFQLVNSKKIEAQRRFPRNRKHIHAMTSPWWLFPRARRTAMFASNVTPETGRQQLSYGD